MNNRLSIGVTDHIGEKTVYKGVFLGEINDDNLTILLSSACKIQETIDHLQAKTFKDVTDLQPTSKHQPRAVFKIIEGAYIGQLLITDKIVTMLVDFPNKEISMTDRCGKDVKVLDLEV